MRRWRVGLMIAALLGLWGCTGGISIPEEKQDYVGHWRAPGMDLTIFPNGRVAYARQKANGNTSVQAPLTAFNGDDFEVGAFIFTTTFEVQKPPHQDGGVWRMTVDGVELTRVEDRMEEEARPSAPAVPTPPSP